MLSALFGSVASAIAGNLIDKAAALFGQFLQNKITREQLQADLAKALVAAFAEIEKAHADALARTYDSFMRAMAGNALMTCVWATVVLSQLAVLLWHQVGIPALVYFTGAPYPSSGSTVEWAYALIGALMGLGPMVLRSGPAAGAGLLAQLKSMIGR